MAVVGPKNLSRAHGISCLKASTIEDVHFEEGKKINEDKYFVI